jgi:hypothetical protein
VADDPTWLARCEQYAAALAAWEDDRPDDCLQICCQMQEQYGSTDGPALWLAAKAKERLADASSQFVSIVAVETK